MSYHGDGLIKLFLFNVKMRKIYQNVRIVWCRFIDDAQYGVSLLDVSCFCQDNSQAISSINVFVISLESLSVKSASHSVWLVSLFRRMEVKTNCDPVMLLEHIYLFLLLFSFHFSRLACMVVTQCNVTVNIILVVTLEYFLECTFAWFFIESLLCASK